MLRSRSFHRSTPALSGPLSRATSASRPLPPPPPAQLIIGRDELEERYLDLRDQHLALRREASTAQDDVRQLHVKLTRLIEEKKKYFKHRRTDREVALEEQIFDLEQELVKRERQNERLRDRVQLLKVGGTEVSGIVATTTQKRVSSAYSHIKSRTDSGLTSSHHTHHPPPGTVYSFRPLSSSKSSHDLRPKSGILKHSTHTHPLPHPQPTASVLPVHPQQPQLPLTATMLMREAKEEIIRLEEIVAEQQMMLDTLLGSQETEYLGPSTAPGPSATVSYQLTTTTTATASLTSPGSPHPSASSNGYHHAHSEPNERVVDLWSKYQQLVLRQESAQKLSTDVRGLIESLYRTLREEQQKVAELRGQLSRKHELNLVINEKEKQIETLRKENTLLQQSLSSCVTQCIDYPTATPSQSPPPSPSKQPTLQALEQLKSTFTARTEVFQRQIGELTSQLSQMERTLLSERSRYDQLRTKFENLQQLSENDQLHIKHLEAKIARLTSIVFPNGPSNGVSQRQVPKSQRPKTTNSIRKSTTPLQAQIVPLPAPRKSTHSSSSSSSEIDDDNPQEDEGPESLDAGITDRLDELLNSLPPVPKF